VAAEDWAGSEKAAASGIAGLLEGAPTNRDTLAVHLATAYAARGRALHERGDHRAALLDADSALAVCDRLASRRARSEAARREAAEHLRKAFTAADHLDPGAELVTGVLQAAGYASTLAVGPVGGFVGIGLSALGGAVANVFLGMRSSQQHIKQAIESLTHLVNGEGHIELAGDLARMCKHLGVEALRKGDLNAGGRLHLLGYAQMQVLLHREGRHALATRLTAARPKDNSAAGVKGPVLFTVAGYDRLVADYEYLIPGVDPTELAARTARAHWVRALALAGKGEARVAMEACEQSLSIWKRLVEVGDRGEFAPDRAEAYLTAARAWAALDDQSRARANCEQAVAVYRTLIEHGQRGDVSGRLDEARLLLATLN
jgi:tetratricopeptide (TPR) repeat protein